MIDVVKGHLMYITIGFVILNLGKKCQRHRQELHQLSYTVAAEMANC